MRQALIVISYILLSSLSAPCFGTAPHWQPAGPNPLSPWGAKIKPEKVWTHYPRPQMRRKSWINLNGLWQYAITQRRAGPPSHWQGWILVPFVPQCKLSGVDRKVPIQDRVWYLTHFSSPKLTHGRQLLLHFGGAMYRSHIYLNGKLILTHNGDYNPFSVNITPYLHGRRQTLEVSCWNPANRGAEPTGKQEVGTPGFTMHLVSTGIWQTVWLEVVPRQSFQSIRITPHLSNETVHISARYRGDISADQMEVTARFAGKTAGTAKGPASRTLILHLPHPKLWSPSHPNLYTLHLRLIHAGAPLDRVSSYFGFRRITVQKAPDGCMRIFLNGRPLFLFGPLEEGYWPDGAYTPPSDAAMKFDILAMKHLGFNMCRKHQIVAPARWYYLCDRLGLIVWQDMPAAFNDKSPASRHEFRLQLRQMVNHLHNDPSVVVWCIFNEGWGQHDTNRLLRWVHHMDPTRLVDGPSGWTDHGYGAMKDAHIYPGPGMWPAMRRRASVLGESGRFPCPIAGHIWPFPGMPYQSGVPGRHTAAGRAIRLAWFNRYKKWAAALRPLIAEGLAAAVYTRWADQVSDHCTGLITCDRRIFKYNPAAIARVDRAVDRYAARMADR